MEITSKVLLLYQQDFRCFFQYHDMKIQFILNYEWDYNLAALKLYHGMVGAHSIADNIPKSVMQYTNYNRKEFMKVMTIILNVIVQGVKVELAYLNMIGRNDTAERIMWESKIKKTLGQ